MLYTAAISLGNLLCGLVENLLPDPLRDTRYGDSYDNESTRWLIASLIVSFPGCFLLPRAHLFSYAKDPQRRASHVPRWLHYPQLSSRGGRGGKEWVSKCR